MLGHSSMEQTARYLNITDEELRRGLQVSWARRHGAAKAKERRGLRILARPPG
jgi:hypothetical protein